MVNRKYVRLFTWLCCLVLMVSMFFGCDSFGRRYTVSDLENPDLTVKIMAVKWAGDNKVTSAVPQLVDFLLDEDESVRFYSIQALRRITGTDYGYDYKAASYLRAAAVKRWRKSLETNGLQNDKD